MLTLSSVVFNGCLIWEGIPTWNFLGFFFFFKSLGRLEHVRAGVEGWGAFTLIVLSPPNCNRQSFFTLPLFSQEGWDLTVVIAFLLDLTQILPCLEYGLDSAFMFL